MDGQKSLYSCGFAPFRASFPFNGTGGLGRQVIEDPVDSLYLAGNPAGNVLEQIKRHVFHSSRHSVHSVYRTDDYTPFICPAVIPHAHALEIGDHGEILPHLALQTILGKLFPEDGVALPYSLQPVTGNGSQAADAQAGAGEGLTINHGCRQPQSHTAGTDLILEEHL